MKTTFKAAVRIPLLLYILIVFLISESYAQTNATVTLPFSVGRTSCGSGTHQIHYYNYNSETNGITLASTPGACIPLLKYGGTNFSFTSSMSSVSYNPKDQNLYYLYTRLSPLRTYVWRWPVGTCPSTNPRLDTLRSFAYDILGVTFDKNGNGYMLEFSVSGPPYTALLRSIDFTTGTYGQADTLELTGGARIYSTGTGDIAMSPSGQMYFVVDNKLFTPDYSSYGSPSKKITCTYIDTVKSPGGNLVGLTFAQGELIAAYQGGGCRFREIAPLTGDTTIINSSTTSRSTSDFASVISGIGAAKNIVSVTPTGTPNQYDVAYDVYVKNYGNYPLSNVQVNDTLSRINGAGNVSVQNVSFVSNPAGLVLNAGFNGTTNFNLLSGTGTLPNYPASSSYAVIRITVRLSGIQQGVVYNNQAWATGSGFSGAALKDASTNGTLPDLNSNDKPDDNGENQPTPLLIAVSSFTPPCSSLSQVMYNEDFGNGSPTTSLTGGGNTPSSGYSGSLSTPLPVDAYKVASNANLGHSTNWTSLTDHTTGTGRMLLVNADANNLVLFSDDLPVLCANQQYSLFFYAAFPGNSNYQTVCNAFGGFKYPKIKIRIRDAVSGVVITENSTAEITSNSWNQYGLKFVMPAGFSNVVFELINDAQGGCGNDILIDDIQFGLCDPTPVVSVTANSAGCIGGATSMDASLSDPGALPGIKEYQWQVSSDGMSWSNIPSATAATYLINSVSAADIGKYYRVIVAAHGNMSSLSCRYISAAYQLQGKTSSSNPVSAGASRQNICPSESVTLSVNGGSLGTNATWRWYTSSCGGVPVGSGSSITVNPAVTTIYYVRAEGDCNTTACRQVTVTVSCDIDDDDDGITDIAESGGVDPFDDHDMDGTRNYQDNDYPGFIDSNGDGINDNFDNDRDGIINSLDRDSDNDGIPDVVESGGVDQNGDGIIDNFSDTDSDGLSQNVDGNNSGAGSSGSGLGLPDTDLDGVPNIFDLDSDNDGIPDVVEAGASDVNNDGRIDGYSDADGDGYADLVDGDANNDGVCENSAQSLVRTGSDINNDGRADSYPHKNFDSDSRINAYDLDSDNDGVTDVREAGFADADNNGASDGVKGADGWDDSIQSLAALPLRNSDYDPLPDYMDIDSDNDGIPDNIEAISTSSYRFPTGADADEDGLDNRYDDMTGFGGNGSTPNDQDGDGTPDYIDTDTDNDTAPDIREASDFNSNCQNDDLIMLMGVDTDLDGLDDRFDADNASKKGTSRFMGHLGVNLGDASPGSLTMVNKCNTSAYERDWRFVAYVLEINYQDIRALHHHDGAKVQWTVSCDKPIHYFIIQKSNDGANFQDIATVQAGNELMNNRSFEYMDPQVGSSSTYYRVIGVDGHGQRKSSRSVMVRTMEKVEVLVYPNPSHGKIYVSIESAKESMATIKLSDSKGKSIVQQKQRLSRGNTIAEIRTGIQLTPGLYYIEVNTADTVKQFKVVIL